VPQTKEDIRTVERLTGKEKLVYDCRKATLEDMDDLMAIAGEASAYLRSCGVDQWQDNFPNPEVFARDISKGNCWLFTHEGKAAGVIVIYLEPEEDYRGIEGRGLTEGEHYGVIHRVAVRDAYRGRGLSGEMMQLAEDIILGRGYPSVRIDTHEDNLTMQNMLKKRGYTNCGVVWLKNGPELCKKRIGLEKIF